MRRQVRRALPWLVTGLVAAAILVYVQRPFGLAGHDAPKPGGPARDVALAGGGVSDGSQCGTKGYHYFPVGVVTDTGGMLPGTPAGPAMVLGSYGAQTAGTNDPGVFQISFSLVVGDRTHTLDLAAPLGREGVAVEIEGPDGLIGGARNLPVTLDDDAARQPNGRIRVGNGTGLSAEVDVPAAALCPGFTVLKVQRGLVPPIDKHSTITGQPLYTLVVSISDPAVTRLRSEVASKATGPVLAADNLVTG